VKTIAENEAKSHLRQRSRHQTVPEPLWSSEEDEGADPPSQADLAPGPEAIVAGQEVLERVRLCVQDLSVTDQEIFWMRERERSYEEITRVLGLPLGTVGVKYARAKLKLLECLKKAGIVAPEGKKKA